MTPRHQDEAPQPATRTMAWNGASGKSSQITGARACRASAPMRSEGFTEYTRSIYNNTSLHQCRRFRHRDDAFTRQPPPDPRSTARTCTQGILGTGNCLSRYSEALQHQPKHECAKLLQPKASNQMHGNGFERAKWVKGSSAVAFRFSLFAFRPPRRAVSAAVRLNNISLQPEN